MRAWLRVARVPTEVLIPTFLTHLTSTCPNIPSSYHIKHKNTCNISHHTKHTMIPPFQVWSELPQRQCWPVSLSKSWGIFIHSSYFWFTGGGKILSGDDWASGPLGLWVSGPMGLLVYWAYWASCATQASPIDMIVNKRASLLRPNFPSSYFQIKTNLKWNFKSIVLTYFIKNGTFGTLWQSLINCLGHHIFDETILVQL